VFCPSPVPLFPRPLVERSRPATIPALPFIGLFGTPTDTLFFTPHAPLPLSSHAFPFHLKSISFYPGTGSPSLPFFLLLYCFCSTPLSFDKAPPYMNSPKHQKPTLLPFSATLRPLIFTFPTWQTPPPGPKKPRENAKPCMRVLPPGQSVAAFPQRPCPLCPTKVSPSSLSLGPPLSRCFFPPLIFEEFLPSNITSQVRGRSIPHLSSFSHKTQFFSRTCFGPPDLDPPSPRSKFFPHPQPRSPIAFPPEYRRATYFPLLPPPPLQ